MRRIVIASFAAALLAAALPASAENLSATSSTRTEPAAQPQQRARAGERQICVREQLSDSRIRRRVCHTAREWQQLHGEQASSG